jgi:hypothetical protein
LSKRIFRNKLSIVQYRAFAIGNKIVVCKKRMSIRNYRNVNNDSTISLAWHLSRNGHARMQSHSTPASTALVVVDEPNKSILNSHKLVALLLTLQSTLVWIMSLKLDSYWIAVLLGPTKWSLATLGELMSVAFLFFSLSYRYIFSTGREHVWLGKQQLFTGLGLADFNAA